MLTAFIDDKTVLADPMERFYKWKTGPTVRSRIAMEDPKPGERPRPTIVDVAKRAEVSIGTASRVINGFSNVNAELRAKVNAAISELGYRPNATAQDMRRGQTRLVGILVRDITVPPLAQFVKAAQDALFGAGYSVLNASSDNEVDREIAILEALAQRRVDGLITTVALEGDLKLRNALESLGAPVVLIDRDQPKEFDAVVVDHSTGTRRAVEHLIDLGHRRIALLTGEPGVRPANERIAGYKAGHAARGVPINESLIHAQGFTEAIASEKTASLILGHRATAIITGGIAMLPGALDAIRGQGWRIPEDLSLVSGSDSTLATLVTPAVTSVRWDYGAMGAAAARLLLERINGKTQAAPCRLVFPTELVLRESCARPMHAEAQ
jgi:LacI family transcriptional regulator